MGRLARRDCGELAAVRWKNNLTLCWCWDWKLSAVASCVYGVVLGAPGLLRPDVPPLYAHRRGVGTVLSAVLSKGWSGRWLEKKEIESRISRGVEKRFREGDLCVSVQRDMKTAPPQGIRG